MKCQILFSWKKMKNITNLSSAEYALRVVKVKIITLFLPGSIAQSLVHLNANPGVATWNPNSAT